MSDLQPHHHLKGAIDMYASSLATVELSERADLPTDCAPGEMFDPGNGTEATVDRLLRCVYSGYLSDGCSCRTAIPASVISAAWAHELDSAPEREDGFFRFAWRGGEWLAYGLRDGCVRGVYCPEHSAERAERSSGAPVGTAC
jgi:hypothetical protein